MNTLGTATLIFLGTASVALAADPSPPLADSGWEFTVAPYLWLAGLSGDFADGGLKPVDVDLSISDVLENLEMGLMGAFEARNGRFSLAADALWVKLSAEADTPFGFVADKAELTTQTLMLTGVAGYSLYQSDEANLDVVAGGRLWGVENELELKGGIADGVSFDGTVTWVDPLVGIKGHADLTSDFYVTGWGLIGGFGVSSKIMWDMMGGVGYRFNDWSSVVAGYRAFGVDYKEDGFTYDVVQSGPILGAVFKF